MRIPLRLAALALLAALAAPASALTRLQLYNIDLDWDPNGNIWSLNSKLCNKDHAPSGTMYYEFRLYQGTSGPATPIRIGGQKFDPIQPGQCQVLNNRGIKVYTKKVPPGEYRVVLYIGEWDGNLFAKSWMHTFRQTFIKGN